MESVATAAGEASKEQQTEPPILQAQFVQPLNLSSAEYELVTKYRADQDSEAIAIDEVVTKVEKKLSISRKNKLAFLEIFGVALKHHLSVDTEVFSFSLTDLSNPAYTHVLRLAIRAMLELDGRIEEPDISNLSTNADFANVIIIFVTKALQKPYKGRVKKVLWMEYLQKEEELETAAAAAAAAAAVAASSTAAAAAAAAAAVAASSTAASTAALAAQGVDTPSLEVLSIFDDDNNPPSQPFVYDWITGKFTPRRVVTKAMLKASEKDEAN